MRKLYEKSEISFALVWIGLYVGLMNLALAFSGGFDDLAQQSAARLLVPASCAVALALAELWLERRATYPVSKRLEDL